MPFTPTMLIVNAVINEQQKNEEEQKSENNDNGQNLFTKFTRTNLSDKHYE